MKILVTGGAGFIGSHVVDTYIAAGHTVAVLDDLSTGKAEQVNPKAKLYKGSIEDRDRIEAVLAEFRPEVINHHAAQISVVESTRQPGADASRNIIGSINLILAARSADSVRKFIYASSGGAMYGNPAVVPCDEETPADPVSPYGLSKYTAERYLRILTDGSSPAATVLRYSNVYGPRQDPHGEAGVCAIFSRKMLDNEPAVIFGDGTQVRDYIYVSDVAAANLAVLTQGDGRSYNIATGVGTATNEVYRALAECIGYTREAVHDPGRPGEVQKIILSPARAEAELGWKATVDFISGTAKTVEWYRGSDN
ncbi:NAD-dependent epimerase/dehydratase family protein [Patescibacteria group bacterium]|nr:NAD-dependent epimerase/dehydratase family protein [Patescibacteria group bacterium]